jgi:hypothetical protein
VAAHVESPGFLARLTAAAAQDAAGEAAGARRAPLLARCRADAARSFCGVSAPTRAL